MLPRVQILHQTALTACCRTILPTTHLREDLDQKERTVWNERRRICGRGGKQVGGGGGEREACICDENRNRTPQFQPSRKWTGLTRRSKVAQHMKLIRLHSQITLPPNFPSFANNRSWISEQLEKLLRRGKLSRKCHLLWCQISKRDEEKRCVMVLFRWWWF